MSNTLSIEEGEFCWAWYNNPKNNAEIELFLCKIIKIEGEYVIGNLYWDDEPSDNPKKLIGTFKDICLNDCSPL